MSRSLQGGVSNGVVSGIKLGRHCPILSHLLFADDSLFFLKAEAGNCKNVLNIIQEYCKASGKLVNLEKSCIVFTENVLEAKRKEIEDCLGIKVARNTGVYLGIPSFWGKTRYEVMSYARDNVVLELENWKHQTLSQEGKKVLIKAVACSVPTYDGMF